MPSYDAIRPLPAVHTYAGAVANPFTAIATRVVRDAEGRPQIVAGGACSRLHTSTRARLLAVAFVAAVDAHDVAAICRAFEREHEQHTGALSSYLQGALLCDRAGDPLPFDVLRACARLYLGEGIDSGTRTALGNLHAACFAGPVVL